MNQDIQLGVNAQFKVVDNKDDTYNS